VTQMHAIVLEDDPVIQMLLDDVLTADGYKVTSYSSSESCPLYADELCPCSREDSCPDLIVSDYDMQTVNGAQFVEHLKRKKCKCKNIAVISGRWAEQDLRQVLPVGVNVFSKPFSLKRLWSWLDVIKGRGESASRGANRRTSVRYPCDFPVELYFNSPGLLEVQPGVARNISMGGMLVECSKYLEPMSSFQVAFTVPEWMSVKEEADRFTVGKTRTVMVPTQARHSCQSSQVFGLQFLESFV
jgi:CheY-like chemotaxis protein